MKSKILLITLVVIAIISAFCINYANTENEVIAAFEPTIETIDGKECFFANGVSIIIEERDDGEEGAVIKYTWNNENKIIKVSKDISIFGGMHNRDELCTSIITMNGGTVKNIFGGGLHKSKVKGAYIYIKGGTITSLCGGGAGSFVKDTDQPNYLDNNTTKENMVNITEETRIQIWDGTIKSTVFGGGEGISYTIDADIWMVDGNLENAYITAAGANGITDKALVGLYGGKIGTVQGINRGKVGEVTISTGDAVIDTLYVGGETSDKNVDATVEKYYAYLGNGNGYGKVNRLEMGKNGDKEIEVSMGKETLTYEKGVVKELGENAKKLFEERIDIGLCVYHKDDDIWRRLWRRILSCWNNFERIFK